MSCLKGEDEIFTWSRGDGTFGAGLANRGFGFNNAVSQLTIKIPKVISQDDGIYRCTFEGKTYTDSSEANLITHSKYFYINILLNNT